MTFNPAPQKIGENGGGGGGVTLYILNCSDSNGWWITGYNAQSLAQDLYNLLSPYFVQTVMVQTTAEFGTILNGTSVAWGKSAKRCCDQHVRGSRADSQRVFRVSLLTNGYARYCYLLGQRVNQYNWTWTSIVGWPFYYVTNTALFSNSQNSWGIYGMNMVGDPGLNAFLEGIDNQTYRSACTAPQAALAS